MKFCITGANGFIGVHLIHHLLNDKHQVIALKRESSSLSLFHDLTSALGKDGAFYSNLEWRDCSLEDTNYLTECFKEVDVVIHLAGYISYLKRDYEQLLKINKTFTSNVVNSCLLAKTKRLIYCSSIAAFSKSDDNDLISESNTWDENGSYSNYGLSKYLGENEVYRGIEEGLTANIVCPGIVLGYGDWNTGSNKLFKNAFSNFSFYSEGITGFIGVEDVAKTLIQLSTSSITNQKFILTSENLSYKEVAFLMATYFDRKKPKYNVKGFLYYTAYLLISIKEFLGMGGMLSKETVKASVAVNRFSNSKIINDLNYKFKPIEEVIKDACRLYKKAPPSKDGRAS